MHTFIGLQLVVGMTRDKWGATLVSWTRRQAVNKEWNTKLHELVGLMKHENPRGREEQSSRCDKKIFSLLWSLLLREILMKILSYKILKLQVEENNYVHDWIKYYKLFLKIHS
jgi:hypothetical protein